MFIVRFVKIFFPFFFNWKQKCCRFFKQFLLLLLVNQMASALFRFVAALCRNLVVANTVGSFILLTLYALGGFVLSRGTPLLYITKCLSLGLFDTKLKVEMFSKTFPKV